MHCMDDICVVRGSYIFLLLNEWISIEEPSHILEIVSLIPSSSYDV